MSNVTGLSVMGLPPLLRVGFGSVVLTNRVVALVSPDSAPIKRMIADARDAAKLVDATYGRRTRSVVLTDDGRVVLSALSAEALTGRLDVKSDGGRDSSAAEDLGTEDLETEDFGTADLGTEILLDAGE